MDIAESSLFTRQIKGLLSDDEYAELQFILIQHPDLGDVIPHSGGIRKIRWAVPGSGKSGGLRIIYYWYTGGHQIRMLYVYKKGKQENLTDAQLAALRKIVGRWDDG